MSTPIRGKTETGQRPIRRFVPGADAVWRLLECLIGGITAAIIVVASLPMLLDVMSPLQALSPTGLLFTYVFTWLFLWIGIAVARERVVG